MPNQFVAAPSLSNPPANYSAKLSSGSVFVTWPVKERKAAARRHQQRAPTTMSFLSRSLRIARMTFLRSCPGFVIIAFAATSFLPPAICGLSVGKNKKSNDLIRWRMLPHVTVPNVDGRGCLASKHPLCEATGKWRV